MLTNFDMRRLDRQFTPYSCETNYGAERAAGHRSTWRRSGASGPTGQRISPATSLARRLAFCGAKPIESRGDLACRKRAVALQILPQIKRPRPIVRLL